jgi:hypothetical protein
MDKNGISAFELTYSLKSFAKRLWRAFRFMLFDAAWLVVLVRVNRRSQRVSQLINTDKKPF